MPEENQTFESYPEKPLWKKLWVWIIGFIVAISLLGSIHPPGWVLFAILSGVAVTYVVINLPYCHTCGNRVPINRKMYRYKTKGKKQVICKNCMKHKSMPCPKCGHIVPLVEAYKSNPMKFDCPGCKEAAAQALLNEEQDEIDRIVSNIINSTMGYRYRDKEFDPGWVNRTIRKLFKQICNDSAKTIHHDNVKCFIGKVSHIAVVVKGDANDLTVHAGIIKKDGISLLGAVGAGVFLSPVVGALALAGSGSAQEDQNKK